MRRLAVILPLPYEPMPPLTSVLIVDDEPSVRDIMARWAASLGLRPETATNADEALATLRTQPCDLAVIDVMMPGHNGLWLAAQLRREHPRTAVVIATGHTELLDPDAEPRPFADLLVKPFQRERFALALDRGRQWRRQALEEAQWHAALSVELGDRAKRIAVMLQEREAEGASALAALEALAAARIPEIAAHGSPSRERWAWTRSLGPNSTPPRACTTSGKLPCPTLCCRSPRRSHRARWPSCGGTLRSAPIS